MANLTGTFQNPAAGRLRVTLTASWYDGTSRDAGFPSTTANMLYTVTVNGSAARPLDKNAPLTLLELDYPGGNAAWAYATGEVSHTFGNRIGTIGFQNLKLILELVKK